MTTRKRYYTTHQIAKLLGVSLPTVSHWIDSGLIQAHRTPGGHRRVSPDALLAFVQDQSLPVPSELVSKDQPRILVVDQEPDFSEMVQDYLTLSAGYQVFCSDTLFEAGYLMHQMQPQVLILDVWMPGLDLPSLLAYLRSVQASRPVKVIACGGELESVRTAKVGVAATLRKPVQLSELRDTLQSLL